MSTTDELLDAHSVKNWVAGARLETYPVERQQELLALLGAFLAHIGKGPDEVVEYCFLRKKVTGERFCSNKRRDDVNQWIEAFVAAQGWTGKQAITNGNMIRSFLIHNAVLIQGSAWRG